MPATPYIPKSLYSSTQVPRTSNDPKLELDIEAADCMQTKASQSIEMTSNNILDSQTPTHTEPCAYAHAPP